MTEIVAEFADGEYRFWLPLPQLFSFEREHGPLLAFYGKIYEAIGIGGDGQFVYAGPGGPDTAAILALIRLALIGGNQGIVNGEEREVGPILAKNLVAEYCYPFRPIEEAAALAFRIADEAVRGIQLKKKQVEMSQTESPSPSSEGS